MPYQLPQKTVSQSHPLRADFSTGLSGQNKRILQRKQPPAPAETKGYFQTKKRIRKKQISGQTGSRPWHRWRRSQPLKFP